MADRDSERRGGRRGGGFDRDRPRRDFDRPREGRFDRQRREGFGGQRRDDNRPREGGFDRDRPRRDFDGPREGGFDRDRPRRDFDRPREGGFDRPRRDFDRPRKPPFGGPPDRRGPSRPPFRPPGPPRPVPTPRTDLVEESEELVAGRRPVSEAFAARRDAKRLLVVPDRRAALESIVLHATTLRLPVVEVEGGTLTSLTGFDGHQGVALVVAQRPPATVEDMLARARARGEDVFVLVLDSLEDPQNLGTLLRSAEACGVHGVIYPTRHAAPLTPAAIKSSAGASEHLLMAPVDSLGGTLADLRAAGLRLVGADEGAALRYSEADLRGPLALVVGSEERGISGALRRRLDMIVRIPMRGRVASLNAAVAGSVLLFAAAEQRGIAEVGDRPDTEEPPLASAATSQPAEADRPAEADQPAEPKPGAGTGEPGEADAADQAAEPELAAEREGTPPIEEPGGAEAPDAADGLLPGGPPADVAADEAQSNVSARSGRSRKGGR